MRLAFAVSIKLYSVALAWAPRGEPLKSQFFSAYHERSDRILNHVRVRGQVGAAQVVQQFLPIP